ncbi:hypothetical protein U9M48_020929 [Paspalum notatum var. saurae]|uniref:Uncharacterized protein n=1 Tax=Paspalum notatum var. saurae TaxID=547442 RepID=A0AAQ3WSZ3_PASNO
MPRRESLGVKLFGPKPAKGRARWAPSNDGRCRPMARPSAPRGSHHQLSSPAGGRHCTFSHHTRDLSSSAPPLPIFFPSLLIVDARLSPRPHRREKGWVTKTPIASPPRSPPPVATAAFRRADRGW